MLKAKLVVVGGDAKAKEVALKLPTVVGRGSDVTLTLPHVLVSRRHTEIFEQDGWLYVKDLGSLNGTYVNNRRIKSAQKLPPNHLLTLGNVTFRAVYEGPSTPSSESPELLTESSSVDSASAPSQDVGVCAMAAECEPSERANASDVLLGDQDFFDVEKSISVSALESLPAQPAPASISSVGKQLGGLCDPENSGVDSIELNLPGVTPMRLQSDLELGSFLKKLPR